MIEGVTTIATLREQRSAAASECLETLNDRISHKVEDSLAGSLLSLPGRTVASRVGVDSKTAMKANPPGAAAVSVPSLVPSVLAAWLSVFRPCFTASVWRHVLVLVAGAVLAPGKRTVTQALRVMGLSDDPGFGRYHEVLSRARWDTRALARRLLLHVLERLLPVGPVVIGIDDTIERRWRTRINARGIYRDPVRSSKGHFVKTRGLRWLSLMVIVPIPWAARRWALPFLTILAPSARWSEANGKPRKTLTTWARQAILQTKRWLPDRRLIFVGDNGFAALDPARHGPLPCLCDHPRLRLDANLFKPARGRRPGQRGRPPAERTSSTKTQCRSEEPEDNLDHSGRVPVKRPP
jgi:hypothetical protein